jgi:hypothetical protein
MKESLLESAGEKLARVRISPKGRAIIDCFLERESEFQSLCVTSDGFLLGMRTGDIGYNDFIGSASSLLHNLLGMSKELIDTEYALTAEEITFLTDRTHHFLSEKGELKK